MNLLNDMQDNHFQWSVEMSSSRKVNSITEEKNNDLMTKEDELIRIIIGKEENQINAVTNAKVEDVDFLASNFFNPAWKNQNYGSTFQKPYPNPLVATPDWQDLFKDSSVQHHISPCSDHCPIAVSVAQEQKENKREA
jgi:hypothetical protein